MVQPNLYAPPQHDGPVAMATGDSALEVHRRAHINAETNLQTIGFLLYLATVSSIIGAVTNMQADPIGALVSVVLGAAYGLGGYWLRRLDARGRMVYLVVTVVGIARALLVGDLLAAGVGVAVVSLGWPILLLALMWGQKATTVMTPYYRDVVVPATPHVKRKTSVVAIVLGVILLALLAIGLVGLVFA